LYIIAVFEGIQKGDLWVDTDPPPPNREFTLAQGFFPCNWNYHDATWDCFWWAQSHVPWGVSLAYPLQVLPVFQGQNGNCIWNHHNITLGPGGVKYYGGYCQVGFVGFDNSPNLTEIAESVGIPIEDPLKANFWPVQDEMTVQYVDQKKSINLLIHREEP